MGIVGDHWMVFEEIPPEDKEKSSYRRSKESKHKTRNGDGPVARLRKKKLRRT